jgi:outer membrane beta-barrel protein
VPSFLRSLVVVLSCAVVVATGSARAADDDILDDLDSGAQKPAPQKSEEIKAAPAPEAADADVDAATKKKQEEPTGSIAAPASLDRVKAVPRKTMLKHHRFEVSPFISASLNDAYYQHLAAAGSAIFYPHDAFGIGVGADWLYANIKSDSVDTVRTSLTSVPAVFELPDLFVHIDAYWVPIYGKLSLFDSQIVHFDIYGVAGMGVAFAGDRRPPLATVGVGQRFVLSDFLALRFEVRDHLFVDSLEVDQVPRSDIQSYVMFLAGVSIFLPPSFDYTYQ